MTPRKHSTRVQHMYNRCGRVEHGTQLFCPWSARACGAELQREVLTSEAEARPHGRDWPGSLLVAAAQRPVLSSPAQRHACSGLLLSAPAQSRRKRCLLTRRHSRHIETRALSHRCHASGSPPAAAGSYARQACGATCVAAAGDGGQGAARAGRDGLRLGGGRGPLCDCSCSVERPPSPGLSSFVPIKDRVLPCGSPWWCESPLVNQYKVP